MESAIKKSIAAALGVLAVAFPVGASVSGATTPVKSGLPQGSEPVKLDPADFTTRIDNPYWPMRPGSRWVYRETDQGGARMRVVVTVTRKTKRIANGITARVVHDKVTEKGRAVEITDDWYAQDKAGNVWYLSEDTKEYKNGKVTTTKGSFGAGVDQGHRADRAEDQPVQVLRSQRRSVLSITVSGGSGREELVSYSRGK